MFNEAKIRSEIRQLANEADCAGDQGQGDILRQLAELSPYKLRRLRELMRRDDLR